MAMSINFKDNALLAAVPDDVMQRWEPVLGPVEMARGQVLHESGGMLGMHREGVTEGAPKLQKAGLIRYTRGHVTALDREGLEQRPGECCAVVKNESDRLPPELASGLRNANGMAWVDRGKTLWAVVNERDELGSELVPDYMTSVQDGAFCGWPYSYYGRNVDERVRPQRPDLVAQAAEPLDVLTAFLSAKGKAMGRPVGVALNQRGALLVADDLGNVVWRASAASP